MTTKLRGITIGVLFLLSGFVLYAQQSGESRSLPPQCFKQSGPRQKAMPGLCKPALSSAQQLSRELPRNDDSATYVSFDVPGATNGTTTTGINDGGTTTGYAIDAEDNYHGFLRDRAGNITSFDVPGDGGGTLPYAVNNAGTTTGYWCTDLTFDVCPAFVRDRNGSIVSFDVPGDVVGPLPNAIGQDGTVIGTYFDVNNIGHGFVRARDGSLTTFDPAGSAWTRPWTISADGTIAGAFVDANGWHGFLRNRNGNISTFDVPGYRNTGEGAFFGGPALSMNPEGEIASSYLQTSNVYDGFLRHRDGTFDTFFAADYPPCCIWSFPTALNADGTIAGYLNDGYDLNRGFVRTRDGNVTLFDVPGAGTGDFQGTVVIGMTAGHVIAGFYTDDGGINHGFLRIPH